MATNSKTLAVERWNRIREALKTERVVRVVDLCRRLGVSSATLRRDLEELEARGELYRVHGGAVAVDSRLDEPVFEDKAEMAAREKHRIAEAALRRIASGWTVYLDGGSTVLNLARELRTRKDVVVVTNSLRAAMELAGEGPRTILVGGELRRLSQTLVGPLTRYVLDALQFDIAFMGTMGISPDGTITTTEPAEAFTKEWVLGRAHQVVLLADRSKYGKVAFARAGHMKDLDVAITDRGLSAEWRRRLRTWSVQLVEV